MKIKIFRYTIGLLIIIVPQQSNNNSNNNHNGDKYKNINNDEKQK